MAKLTIDDYLFRSKILRIRSMKIIRRRTAFFTPMFSLQ